MTLNDALAPTQSATTTGDTETQGIKGSSPHIAVINGARLGDRYEIRGYLGEGGMGAVYRVFDEVLGEEVALKSVRGAYADQRVLRAEVRVAQRVTHRNVCRTFDLVDVGGTHFVKMEYIAGETLAQRIEKVGPLPLREVVRIARAIVDGLAAAHAQGIVHRDLKPGNVMLSGDRVVLMDFGLARAISDGKGDLAGTPSYMSPEQLAGQDLDARSDLFALGCLVFEMLAGKRAFASSAGSYSELAGKRLAQPTPVAREHRRDTPRWLACAIGELLSVEPAVRSVGERRLRRGPRRALVAGIAIGAAAVVGVAAWWLSRPPPPWEARTRDLYAYVGNADEPRLSPDGKSILFVADPANTSAWGVYTLPSQGGHPTLLSRPGTWCAYASYLDDGRSIAMQCEHGDLGQVYVIPATGGVAVPLTSGTHVERCGDEVAIVRTQPGVGDTVLRRTRDGHERTIAHDHYIHDVRCSLDGSQLAYVVSVFGLLGGPLRLVDRDGRIQTLLEKGALGVAFVPDGRSLVVARQIGDAAKLVELDLATRAEHELLPKETQARAPDVSRDGKTLVYHHDDTSMPLHAIGPTGAAELITFQRGRFVEPAPVVGGESVIAIRGDRYPQTAIVITLATGATRTLVEADHAVPTRDGKRVLVWHTMSPTLQSIPIEGGPVTDLARLPGAIVYANDAPDGVHVRLERGDRAENWRLPPGGDPEPEVVEGLLFVAPSGGWRAVGKDSPSGSKLALVAPGQPLATPAFEVPASGKPAWVDGTHLSYCDKTRCHVLDVITRTSESHPIKMNAFDGGIAASPDGKHWFYSTTLAQVTLVEVTNFASRPWRR